MWDVATRKILVRMSHADAVIGARFSPDGTHAVSWSYDGTAKVATLNPGKTPSSSVLLHQGVVRSAAFTVDGNGVWTRSDDGTARFWWDDGRQVSVLRHSAEVLGLVSALKGNLLVTFSADGSARLWDLAPADRFAALHHDGKIMSAAFSSDGRTLLTSSNDHTAVLWDVESAKQLLILRHGVAVVGASFSPDGGAILTWSEDGTIRLSATRDGGQFAEFKGAASVRRALYTHDRLLAWFTDGTARLWNIKSGAVLAERTGCGDQMEGLFSADGRNSLIRCSDGTLLTFDSKTGTEIGHIAHEHAQGAIFSPDGTRVLTWSSEGTVRIWDIRGKKVAADISHNGGMSGVLFSQHGERVVTWGGDNAARIWDPSTGRQLNTLNHTKWVRGAVFSDDGNRVWTWSDDGSARLWEVASGKELRRLQHGDAIAEAVLLAGGRMLATRSVSTTAGWNLRLWDVRTAEVLGSLTVSSPTRIADDGRYLATWSDDASVMLWPLWVPTKTLVDRASRITERLRPLSPLAECQAHLVDAVGCDQFPATTERLLAMIGEDKHLRSGAPHALGAGEKASNVKLSDDVKVELVVNDRSEAFIFHNRRFSKTLKRLEYNPSTLRMVFRFTDGSTRDFGLSVDARLGRYFDYTERVLTVLMDEKTGKPIEGTYYPLLLY